MSFFQRKKTKKRIERTFQKNKIRQTVPTFSPDIPTFLNREKRISRPALPGSMTVEAAIVLPLFLFAAVNMLSMLLMFRTFSLEEGKLHQAARELSLLAYGQEETAEQDIRLVKVSPVRAVIPLTGFPPALIANGCVMHKWIGYDLSRGQGGENGQKEEMVFVTKSGEAYHRDRGCIYLNPSIQIAERQTARQMKNRDGKIYTPCTVCSGNSDTVYVTEEGIRYHSTVNCSGLRRTIDSIPLKEAAAAGYHACPRCG